MKHQRPERISIKPLWLVALILIQVAFIVAGLAITFWTLNEWYLDRRLDAIFGAGMGGYCFFFTWTLLRRWVRDRADLWRRSKRD